MLCCPNASIKHRRVCSTGAASRSLFTRPVACLLRRKGPKYRDTLMIDDHYCIELFVSLEFCLIHEAAYSPARIKLYAAPDQDAECAYGELLLRCFSDAHISLGKFRIAFSPYASHAALS